MLRALKLFCMSADMKPCHRLFMFAASWRCSPSKDAVTLTASAQPEGFNQMLSFGDLGDGTQRAACQQHEYRKRLFEPQKPLQHMYRVFCIPQSLNFLHFHRSIEQQTKPWLTIHHITDEKNQPTILSRLAEPAHPHLSTLWEAALLCDSPAGTNFSFKSPPEGCRCGKEGASALIWLCNTRPFAIGQWNSISFNPPSVNSYLKSLHRHCLLFARSHLNLSSAGCFQWEVRIELNTWWAKHSPEEWGDRQSELFCMFYSPDVWPISVNKVYLGNIREIWSNI